MARGIAAELAKWEKGNDPLYRNERLEYVKGMRELLTACEVSRITLLQAMRRHEEELTGK